MHNIYYTINDFLMRSTRRFINTKEVIIIKVKFLTFHTLIISETTGPMGTKQLQEWCSEVLWKYMYKGFVTWFKCCLWYPLQLTRIPHFVLVGWRICLWAILVYCLMILKTIIASETKNANDLYLGTNDSCA